LYPKIQIKILAADLTLDESIGKVKAEVKGLNVSVLINNVGGSNDKKMKPFYNENQENIDYDLKINVFSTLKITNIILPIFKERNKGRILSISSLSAVFPVYVSIYGSCKRLIVTWTNAIQKEFEIKGLDITAVASTAGFVATPGLLEVIHNSKGEWDMIKPMALTPEEYAEAELDLYGTHIVSAAHWKHTLNYYVMELVAIIPPSIFRMLGVKL